MWVRPTAGEEHCDVCALKTRVKRSVRVFCLLYEDA